MIRVGYGYDVHRLVEGRKLILGGVDIPFEKGLLGHSDADVLLHAITDALFGAASLGDIGSHFQMTGATISYHLGILKKAELVFENREKNYIYYELNTSVVEEVMLWLAQLKGENNDAEKE